MKSSQESTGIKISSVLGRTDSKTPIVIRPAGSSSQDNAAKIQTSGTTPTKMRVRLQPCTSSSSPSVSLAPGSNPAVINLPTVYRSSDPESKVTLYRLFNSSQLAGVSKPNSTMKPEQFVASLSRDPRYQTVVKRKRGRPRLNRPHELKPVLPLPIRQTAEEAILTSQSPTTRAEMSSASARSDDSGDPPLLRFTIADLPPEQRPSFGFRRDMRKQLMTKSLDERISWALGKKVTDVTDTVKESNRNSQRPVEQTTRSGREVRRPVRMFEDVGSDVEEEEEVLRPEPDPTPTKVRVVFNTAPDFNSGDPTPKRGRGRPRKSPHQVRLQPSTGDIFMNEKETMLPVDESSRMEEAEPQPNEPTLSEDYILRNLKFWEKKRQELERNKAERRGIHGPPKSVNVMLQNSSISQDDENAEIMRLEEYRESNSRQLYVPGVPRYRPILPRVNPETLKNMTQEERLQEFRRRSEHEKKMRLIKGVDFVPVDDDEAPPVNDDSPPEPDQNDEGSGDGNENPSSDEKVSARLEEILQEIIENVSDDESKEQLAVFKTTVERDVDIDAESEVSHPVKTVKPAKKKRPVSHGTLTDHNITQYDDPDVVLRQAKTPQKRRLEETANVSDDEPPLIAAKPKKDKLARPAAEPVKEPPKKQKPRPPNWPFGPAAPEEKRVFRRPTKPSTKLAPTAERRLIYSLMQNAVQLANSKQNQPVQNTEETGDGAAGSSSGNKQEKDKKSKQPEEQEPLNYIVLESESEIESSDEEPEKEGEEKKKKDKPAKKFSCAAVTIKLAATKKASLVFAPPTNVIDESAKVDYDEGNDSGVEENGVLWKFPAQFFNGAKYEEIAPPPLPEESPTPEQTRKRPNRAPTTAIPWNAPDFGLLPSNNRCPHCPRYFSDTHRLWRHLISHSDKKPFICSLCGKGHRLPEYLTYHHRLHHSDGEELLPCPHCPKRALFYSQLEAHLLNKHDAPRPFHCGQCPLTFALEASLEDHVRSTHEQQSTMCDLCGISLPDAMSRKLHRRQHAEDRPFSCPDCPDKAFKSKRLLGHHRMVEHEMERQHECHKCLKTFFFLKDMQRHMSTAHSQPEPFQCSQCNQQFLRRQQLTRHMERSHKGGVTNRPFRCQMCGSCFPTERALERHQNNVHGEKPQPPPEPTPPPPPEVETNPNKRKMFSCRYCDLLFTARSAVTSHIECVHIDTLALRCRHCRQPCLNHADLERHILEHKDRRETLQTRRPNRRLCVACGELTSSRAELERHLKEEHDELVQFMCPICGEFFLTNQLYYEHTCRQEGEEGGRRDQRQEAFSSEDEAAAGQQSHGNMESQEVESYQEWPRRSQQWNEYSRQEEGGGHYYSGW